MKKKWQKPEVKELSIKANTSTIIVHNKEHSGQWS